MSIAGGTVRKRKWSHEGRKRSTWGWTLNVDGKQVRRQGFASSEEAQTDLDAYREQIKAPTITAETQPAMTLGEAFDRYLALKARKKTVDEDARNAKCQDRRKLSRKHRHKMSPVYRRWGPWLTLRLPPPPLRVRAPVWACARAGRPSSSPAAGSCRP